MKANRKLMVMAFDGEHKLDAPNYGSDAETWEHSDGIGEQWDFYPIHFIVSASGKTVVDARFPFEFMIGKRVRTVAKLIEAAAVRPDMQ